MAVLVVHTPSAISSSVCQETLFHGSLLCPSAALINVTTSPEITKLDEFFPAVALEMTILYRASSERNLMVLYRTAARPYNLPG